MLTRLLLYLSILLLGATVGNKNIMSKKVLSKTDILQNISLLFLLFVMGMRIAMDKKVISSFLTLGFQALILSISSIFFSVLFVKIVWGYLTKNKKGERTSNDL